MRRDIVSALISRPGTLLCLAFIGASLLFSHPALAQTASGGLWRRGSGSAGGGVFMDVSGDRARLGSEDGTVGPLWLLYGAVFVAPRLAIGAELTTLGTQEFAGSSAYGSYRHVFRTYAIHGVARMRVFRQSFTSLDLVGGVGAQFSRAELHEGPAGSESDFSYGSRYWSYVFGADLPMAARHVIVAPFTRFYLLRGTPQSRGDTSSSQTALAVGVTAGFRW